MWPLQPKSHPHLHVVYPVPTNVPMTTELQSHDCFIRNEPSAIPKHAFPEAKGRNPTAELNLLWVRHPFREGSNVGQILQVESFIFIRPCIIVVAEE